MITFPITLDVYQTDEVGRAIFLSQVGLTEPATYSIGSAADRDIVLDALGVSANHALLIASVAGLEVVDQASTSGTSVDGRVVSGRSSWTTGPLRIGPFEIVLSGDDLLAQRYHREHGAHGAPEAAERHEQADVRRERDAQELRSKAEEFELRRREAEIQHDRMRQRDEQARERQRRAMHEERLRREDDRSRQQEERRRQLEERLVRGRRSEHVQRVERRQDKQEDARRLDEFRRLEQEQARRSQDSDRLRADKAAVTRADGEVQPVSGSSTKQPTTTGTTQVLWFGTNRKPVDPSDIRLGFSGERDARMRLGVCNVHIPESHDIGSIGSPWWKRLWKRADDRLKLVGLEEYAAERFWDAVSAYLGKLDTDEREAVVFVHGYNVSFVDAALRAAQLGADLTIRGCMAFFSWPSKGSTHSYVLDEASIEASEPAITQFLVDFATKSGAAKLHIIAHSMGNRGVLRAVNRIAAAATRLTGKPFDQIILAAPDVDADVFRNLSEAYSQVSRRTTLYVSSKDWAVGASRWLHGFHRAGLLPPVMVAPGIDTVNVTHADLTMLGHGYVAEARLVLADMHALLRFDAHPTDRSGLRVQTSDDGQSYWLIGR